MLRRTEPWPPSSTPLGLVITYKDKLVGQRSRCQAAHGASRRRPPHKLAATSRALHTHKFADSRWQEKPAEQSARGQALSWLCSPPSLQSSLRPACSTAAVIGCGSLHQGASAHSKTEPVLLHRRAKAMHDKQQWRCSWRCECSFRRLQSGCMRRASCFHRAYVLRTCASMQGPIAARDLAHE